MQAIRERRLGPATRCASLYMWRSPYSIGCEVACAVTVDALRHISALPGWYIIKQHLAGGGWSLWGALKHARGLRHVPRVLESCSYIFVHMCIEVDEY